MTRRARVSGASESGEETGAEGPRVARALRQRLESLRRAGVDRVALPVVSQERMPQARPRPEPRVAAVEPPPPPVVAPPEPLRTAPPGVAPPVVRPPAPP